MRGLWATAVVAVVVLVSAPAWAESGEVAPIDIRETSPGPALVAVQLAEGQHAALAKGKKLTRLQKVQKGLFAKRSVNVKQMDVEKKLMDKHKAHAREIYQKMLKGTYRAGKGKKKGGQEKEKKAKAIVAKGDKLKKAREAARKKMKAAKLKAKEKSKKQLLKNKEKMQKKTKKKLAGAKERAAKKAAKNRTKEGWIQKAAEDRKAAWVAKVSAAKVVQLMAKGKASQKDLTKADSRANRAMMQAKKSEEKAIKMNQQKKAMRRAARKARKVVKKATKKKLKKLKAKKAPAKKKKKRAKKAKKVKKSWCTHESCSKKCKSALCLKWCMRCQHIKTEKLSFVPAVGLVSSAVVHPVKRTYIRDPTLHAEFVDHSMNRLHKIEKNDNDASKFAVDQFKQVHCEHCRRMCDDNIGYTKPQKVVCKAKCSKWCAGLKAEWPAKGVSHQYCQRCLGKCKTPQCKAWCKKKHCTSAKFASYSVTHPAKPKPVAKPTAKPIVKPAAAKPAPKPPPKAKSPAPMAAQQHPHCKRCLGKCKSAQCRNWCQNKFCNGKADGQMSMKALNAALKGPNVHVIKMPTVVVERHVRPPIPKPTVSALHPAKREIIRRATAMAHKHHVSVKAAVKVAQSKVNKLSKVKPTAP